ncbi:MAG: alpha/beta fold hydrolase [Rhizobiaceae bacterium]|nr:alpha/beta fold hydrolase [Rhizobiaceae bacterium]
MTRQSRLRRGDADLRVHEEGDGLATVFQHGLGGSAAQVAQTFPSGLACRRLTLECRGHGGSALGKDRPYSFGLFADDVLAAVDAAGFDRFVAGGVSMGAAIALRLACLCPERVVGLVLVRPAWTFAAAPENLRPIAEVADLVRRQGRDAARAVFTESATAARLAAEAPDNLASLIGYFDRPDIDRFAEVLSGIAGDGPGVSRSQAAALDLPTLVVGNTMDALHPLAMAEELAATIPGADYASVPSKAADTATHFSAVHARIAHFLHSKFDVRSLP